MTSAQATGMIRLYQSVIGGILLLNVPISFVALKIWDHPVLVAWSGIAVALIAFIARLFILKSLTGLEMRAYIKNVIFRSAMAGAVAGLLNEIMVIQNAAGMYLALGIAISLISTMVATYFVGLENKEKRYFLNLASIIHGKLISCYRS